MQTTAYEMRISDWSSDVCSSDLPYAGVGPIYAALSAFVLAEAAYYCEIVRAGISSVRTGQMQAATALGLTRWQALRYVVLPQAFHNMTPSLVTQTIALLKDTRSEERRAGKECVVYV